MRPSLDPEVNPILRIYSLFSQDGFVQDSRRYLKLEQAPLRELGGAAASDLLCSLRASAVPFNTCQLCLDGQPIVDFWVGPVQSWFDWESIADLAKAGKLDGRSAEVLGSWKRRLETYLDSGVWSAGGKPEVDCLKILERLADHDRSETEYTLEVSLSKRDLIERLLLPEAGLADEVSAFLWHDLETMCGAYADFEEFLDDAGAERPIAVFVFEPLPAYAGDFFKVLPLHGPPESRAEREQALIDALGGFTRAVLSRYRTLRRRLSSEARPQGRLDLPPALFLHGDGSLSDYPEHPLLAAGPWRSWLVFAVLSWLARSTENGGGMTTFDLPAGHRLALEVSLEDVRWTGESVFEDAGWSARAALVAWHAEHAAGSDHLRGLWARALAETPIEALAPPALWEALERVRQRFYGMMSLRDVTSESFVLVQADWPAVRSRELAEELEVSHVIVARAAPREAFFLVTRQQALARLGAVADQELSTGEALGLEEESAPPQVLDADSSAAAAPESCLVTEQGRLLGFRAAVLPEDGPWEARHRLRGAAGAGPARLPDSAEVVSWTLRADLPTQILAGETLSLRVSLVEDPAGRPMTLPPDAAVDVLVQPRRGLDLQGAGEGRLLTSRSDPLSFQLRAAVAGPAEVAVMAFHQGQRLETLTLKAEATHKPGRQPQSVSCSQQSDPAAVVEPPDLNLIILEQFRDGLLAFTVYLYARDPTHNLNFNSYGPVQLRYAPYRFFREFYSDIETLPYSTPAEKARAEEYLAARGTYLFEQLPQDMRTKLWSIRDQIRSVRVQSQVPWIPWELLKLEGTDENGRIEEGPFLCEAFDMTRWLVGVGLQPKMSLRNLAVVVPADSGLRKAAEEVDHLLSLAGGDRRVERIPANSHDVRTALAKGDYDGWHFVGHGSSRPNPDRSVIQLEAQEVLTPADLSGKIKNLGLARPLVFLNACQVGRPGMTLTGIGGWAQRFLEAGAAAFIGAYWNVDDKIAYEFAKALYSRLLRGVPIGRAAKEARQVIRELGGSTWLAYTVFADPSAVVESSAVVEPTVSHG